MENFLKKNTLKRFNLTDFRFECFLGKGASGSVYKHVQNNHTYTVKVLNKDGWGEDEFYEDLLWQTEIIKQMGELEKSIQFLGYDVVQKDNFETIAFIMDYFETNGDLYDHINSKVYWEKTYDNKGYCFKRGYSYKRYIMPQSEKIQITKSFLEAVEEIHSKRVGIVHGDIKTNNLLLDKQDNIKLIDFGASIFSEENDGLCKTDWNHGTLGYSSPEDTYHNLLGKASDIYSLGVSLIEVWSGSIWEDGNDFQTCRNEVLRSLRLIEKNDKEIGTILRKMVGVNSKKRPKIEKVINYFSNKVF